MTDNRPPRQRRPRLGPDERARLLAEIAKYGPPPEHQEREIRAAMTGIPTKVETLPRVVDVWNNLLTIPVDPAILERNLVITASRADPAHAAFDVLRTRLMQALSDNGWNRVGITSPTRDCGKTFTAVNLAITLSRYDNFRTVLLDMDMRNPSVGKVLGTTIKASVGDYLRGAMPSEAYLRRMGQNNLNIGGNLAIGINDRIEPYAAELFQQHKTAEVLARMQDELNPDVVLFDLPPAMAQDDVIAFRPQFDCILMVIGGGITKASEVREVVRRLGDSKPIVGVVLNKAEGAGVDSYSY
jgi:Mrp family chromosome partitioning ATPase